MNNFQNCSAPRVNKALPSYYNDSEVASSHAKKPLMQKNKLRFFPNSSWWLKLKQDFMALKCLGLQIKQNQSITIFKNRTSLEY